MVELNELWMYVQGLGGGWYYGRHGEGEGGPADRRNPPHSQILIVLAAFSLTDTARLRRLRRLGRGRPEVCAALRLRSTGGWSTPLCARGRLTVRAFTQQQADVGPNRFRGWAARTQAGSSETRQPLSHGCLHAVYTQPTHTAQRRERRSFVFGIRRFTLTQRGH